MSINPQPWKILDKRGFIIAAMERLAGDAPISFEGDLQALKLSSLRGAFDYETATLKRNTTWPRQDFVVLPLQPAHIAEIGKAIGGTLPRTILHIQIEKQGSLQLGVYDNFQATGFGEMFDAMFVDDLLARSLIKRNSESK